VEKLLSDLPAGQALLTQVRDFYGPSFKVEAIDTPGGASYFHIDTGGAGSQALRTAKIQLNLQSKRQRAAAIHVLLHLCLPARGYAFIDRITPEAKHCARKEWITDVQSKIQNVVAHDCFLEEFLEAGLPLSEFVSPRLDFPKYEETAKSWRGIKLTPENEWYAQGWWGFEYFNNYISSEHGDLHARQLAENAEKYAIRVLPNFADTAALIRDWVARKKHCSVGTYEEAMRELLQLIFFPTVGFCLLEAAEGRPPNVLRLYAAQQPVLTAEP
jgi:hypothetical protein